MKRALGKFAAVLGLGLTLGFGAQATQAADINPFNFNVYSLSDIGTSGSGYGSDFQGVAGAAGNAYFTNFSLNDLNQAQVVPGYSLTVGGDAIISGQINNGGIEAGSNVAINNTGVFGDVYAGGNLSGIGGTVNGNATLGGTDNTTNAVTVTGTITQNTSYAASLNFNSINDYLTTFSTSINNTADTTGYTNNYGELIINAASGDNYVTIDAAELNSAWGVTINGAADSVVYINVDGINVSLDSTTWTYNGLTSGDVLLNYGEATDLSLSGGNIVNILAAFADVDFSYGHVDGNLIAGNLTGAGQVNLGGFEHGVVPEPSSALALLAGSTAMLIRRKRRARIA